MAKVSFNKLGLKPETPETMNIEVGEGISFELKTRLPLAEKLQMLEDIVNQSVLESNFLNDVKINMFTVIEMVNYYTNITFTEKQKENLTKLYDLITTSGLWNNVKNNIPEEYQDVAISVRSLVVQILEYQHSAVGILETISRDYKDLNLEAEDLRKVIADPDNMTLLKDVLTKLG